MNTRHTQLCVSVKGDQIDACLMATNGQESAGVLGLLAPGRASQGASCGFRASSESEMGSDRESKMGSECYHLRIEK